MSLGDNDWIIDVIARLTNGTVTPYRLISRYVSEKRIASIFRVKTFTLEQTVKAQKE